MLGIGGFTPLDGFMTQADWKGVCDEMRLADGLFWPIPITLSTDRQAADAIQAGAEIALADPDDGSSPRDDEAHREVRDRQGARMQERCSRRPTPSTPAWRW